MCFYSYYSETVFENIVVIGNTHTYILHLIVISFNNFN